MHVGKDYISGRTFALFVGGLALLIVVAVAGLTITQVFPPDKSESIRALVSDAGSIGFGLLSAAVLVFAASRFRKGNPLRQIWLLLGLGIGAYAIGDIIWTVLEVNSGFADVPYPSAADVPYLAMYVFFAAGLFRAARAFRRMADVERALMSEIILVFFASIVVYSFVCAPVIADSTTSLLQKVLGAVYPIGDIVVLFGPAFFIVLAAAAVRRSQTVLQWRVLAIGLVVMSVSDIAFTWLDWTGRYFSGHLVDFGWMLSLLLIAVAGLLAADAAAPRAATVVPAVPRRR